MKIDIENLRVVGELTHKYINIFFYYKMNNARKKSTILQTCKKKIIYQGVEIHFWGHMRMWLFRVDWYFDGNEAKIDWILIENNLSDYHCNLQVMTGSEMILTNFDRILAEI